MREELLQVLAEPGTGASLELEVKERRDGAVWEGTLRPTGGKDRRYPVREGIPRFVPDSGYNESFGLQWNLFSTVQLDSANGADYSRCRFEDETLWTREELDGRWVLDGGCGSGRFAEIAAGTGARVIAMDYSRAVDAAAGNLSSCPNVHFVQGDLLNPPFKPGSLDFVYSIGVLQHTPDPQGAIRRLLDLLGTDGGFAFTIYSRRWYTKLNAKYLLRPVTKRLPAHVLLGLIRAAMPVLFPLTDVLFRLPAVGGAAKFTIPVANYVGKADFTREQRYQEALLDTFDMLSPAFDSPMTWEEVRGVLEERGCPEHRFLTKHPVNVIGRVANREAAFGCVRAAGGG